MAGRWRHASKQFRSSANTSSAVTRVGLQEMLLLIGQTASRFDRFKMITMWGILVSMPAQSKINHAKRIRRMFFEETTCLFFH